MSRKVWGCVMAKTVNLIALSVNLLSLCLCASSLKVYYVQPAGPSSSSECPSHGLPCHSLQYFVNHSNFTNNSLFLFLPGEHHLDSVVNISNVDNLALEGVSSGVKILCDSFPSGFNIREFTELMIENLAVSKCIQSNGVSLHLESGSGLNIDKISIKNSSGATTGVNITGVTGSLSISNSIFTSQGGNVAMNFTHCQQPSHFTFSSNNVTMASKDSVQGLIVHIYCPNVHILLVNSTFQGNLPILRGLWLNTCVLTNISVTISSSSFTESAILAGPNINCEIMKEECSYNVTLSQVSVQSSAFSVYGQPIVNYISINIDQSIFSSNADISFGDDSYAPSKNINDTYYVQARLRNVSFVNKTEPYNKVCRFYQVRVLIVDCNFENNIDSAIRAVSSKLVFQGYNLFKNNSAPIGAGIQLTEYSYMSLQLHTYVLFENNHAKYVGGAIYVDSQEGDPCFFKQEADSLPVNATVHFVNNSAGLGGFSLYGNNIAQCDNLHTFFSNISNTESVPSAVASDPHKVCLCEDDRNQPNCSLQGKWIQVYPGENFNLHLAVVGNSFDGAVPGVIRAYLEEYSDPPSSPATVGTLQSSQTAHKPRCENFTYTIYSTAKRADLMLTLEEKFLDKFINGKSDLTISVSLLKCPVGFLLRNATGQCECDSVLQHNGISCDINYQSILRPGNTWIGFVNPSDTPEDVMILFHPHCPIGYCLPYDTNITSNTSDRQCAPHRTGLLCGKCEEGYSLTLGNGTCATCSNTYLLLILPVAVSGLLLVAILFALNLTVTEGTINGLIFYANVIGMNHSTLYSGETNWLYTFLAWLNLDLGITTCYYDSMDSYAETWLQFIFPVYLWIIILVIIKLYSRFPTLANRLGGGNAVKVLATLLILSYTKLQRTVVTIMSFTTLEYPDGVTRYVWLDDANVDYFKGKHVYLGLAAIFALVFLILPYTLCLVFFQQLQACSNRTPFQWVNKFKPLFDSYAGPYKDKYRFWTGMLLLVRTLLIILFTANTSGSVDLNLLIILTVSLALTLANSNGMYKKWPLNYLEVFFYIQLGVFAGGMMYARHNSEDVSAVANTSIGLSLAVFLLLIGYHSLLSLKRYYYRRIGYAEMEEVPVIHERET